VAERKDVIVGIIIGFSILAFLVLLFLMFFGLYSGKDKGFVGFGKKVALVEIYGSIESPSDIIRQLKEYGEDSSIPAIVLDINSPGGVVAPSQEIYEEVKKLKDKGKKIVASFRSVAASGGYYIACAADTIVSNPGTITGSIGVIFEWPVMEELFKKIGLKFEVVKSGEQKDVGSFSRPVTPKEKEMLQSVIDDSYDQFVNVIVEGRGIPKEEVMKLADGRIFTGRQAKELKLVDEIGNLEDAIEIAGKMGEIKGKPTVIKERKRKTITLFDLLTQKFKELTNLDENQASFPQLKYIFK
jgi:protease-4